MKYPLMLGLLVLPSLSAVNADDLGDFDAFRSYPYLDRGYREAERNDWPEVERTMRHLLERVPQHQEAQRLLIQALAQQRRFEAAEQATLRLGEAEGATLLELRLAWIEQDPPNRERVQAWLEEAHDETRERLWLAYAQSLEQRADTSEALTWLSGLEPNGDETPLRRWRAGLAEQLQDWPRVERELAPLADRNQLSDDDWQRLMIAHLQASNLDAADALLAQAPDPERGREMLVVASQRAVASEDHEQAKQWLLELATMQSLTQEQQMSLIELARETRDLELFTALGRDSGVSCLDRTQWLANHAESRARQELASCLPGENPGQWLVLAQQLEAFEVLEQHTLEGAQESQRQALLVELWQGRGDTRRARDWLAAQPESPFILRQRAELYQQAGETAQAANMWERLHRLDDDPAALDQASYLYLELGQPERALALLEPAFDRYGSGLPRRILTRLASLYANPDHPMPPQRAAALLPLLAEEPRRLLLVRLASEDMCDVVSRSIGETPTQAGEWHALGTCAMPERPGEAVVHYRQALALGDSQSQLPLAYALQAAGDAPNAYSLWQTLAPETLDSAAAMAAARSAVAVGETAQAEHFWTHGEPQHGDDWQTGADIALALGNTEAAWQRQRQALEYEPQAERYYAAAATARTLGDEAQASAWLAEAAELAPDNPIYRLDHALRLASSDDEVQRQHALPLLERSLAAYPENHQLRETLAARHIEAGDNPAARQRLREGIDLVHRPLHVGDETPAELIQRRYQMRRQHETLSRRNRVSLTATSSPAAVTATERSQRRQSTSTLTWDHALGEEPIRDGRQLALFGRVQHSGSLGSNDRLGTGVGLRAKPFADQNVNFSTELYHEQGIHGGDTDDTRTEPLLRMMASFLDQGEFRNDWRTDETHWQERSLYTDLAWWTRSGNKSALARYRHGQAYTLPVESPQTLMPYVMAQASASEEERWEHDTRIGVGLRWQRWFDEDSYNAYRGNVALRVEYQHSLGGELHDNEGGFMAGLEVNF